MLTQLKHPECDTPYVDDMSALVLWLVKAGTCNLVQNPSQQADAGIRLVAIVSAAALLRFSLCAICSLDGLWLLD